MGFSLEMQQKHKKPKFPQAHAQTRIQLQEYQIQYEIVHFRTVSGTDSNRAPGASNSIANWWCSDSGKHWIYSMLKSMKIIAFPLLFKALAPIWWYKTSTRVLVKKPWTKFHTTPQRKVVLNGLLTDHICLIYLLKIHPDVIKSPDAFGTMPSTHAL